MMRMVPFNRYQTNYSKQSKLPFLIVFVLIATIVACTIGRRISISGFAIQGFAWFVTLIFSVFIFLRAIKRTSFPYLIWLPWVILLVVNMVRSDYTNALQRTMMMICPIITACAVSTFQIRKAHLMNFFNLLRKNTLVFFAFVLIITGLPFTGALPQATALAPQVMTGALLATVAIIRYILEGSKRMLYYWVGLAAVPFIAMTRTGMIATMVTFPLTLAPLKMIKRFAVAFIIVALGISAFYTERIQRKMFYSGKGEISDVTFDNPDFFTSGRKMLWDLMEAETEKKPLWGYGANANEAFILDSTGIQGQPHNDWLRLRFDYGYVGTFTFAICMFFQLLHAWIKARKTTGETRILFYVGASSFLPFVLFMLTDNIILYCQFFGNLQFIILGLAYASLKTSETDAAWIRYQTYLSSVVKQNSLNGKSPFPYEIPPT